LEEAGQWCDLAAIRTALNLKRRVRDEVADENGAVAWNVALVTDW
jgi:hypothetical protein